MFNPFDSRHQTTSERRGAKAPMDAATQWSHVCLSDPPGPSHVDASFPTRRLMNGPPTGATPDSYLCDSRYTQYSE